MEPDNNIIDKIKNTNRSGLALVGAITLLIIIIIITIAPSWFTEQQFQTSENDTKLSTQIESEEGQLRSAFSQRFPFFKDGYTINKIVLLGDGNYAAISLTMESLVYRAIMTKEADGWKVRGLPSAVLFYEDFDGIPREVIKAINDLEAY